ncbi:MAG: septum site-determining protein MinC [Clostridia bacterium]|nr:septum site-determining protein MinC [[Bacteroides] pectinophilus]MDD5873204.1 septum site-determining protein MinC [Clostridia bacterium]
MVNNSVVIKGSKHGIVVVLDDSVSFDELKEAVRDKFSGASKFFDKANMAISFEGRSLNDEQQRQLLDIISEVSDINIVCVIDNDELKDAYFKRAVEAKLDDMAASTGQFYKGTLRSGQILESESSIIILGDVNPGGKVIAKGNVIVLGSLKGNIYAGADGNEDAFVVAIDMEPMQIKIGDVIARCSDGSNSAKSKTHEPRIAYVDEGNIYIEKLERDVLADIRI